MDRWWTRICREPHYVYALVDPRDNEMRYIGCTHNLRTRMRAHCRKKALPQLIPWFDELRAIGFIPRMIVLRECDSWWSGRDAEMELISEHSKRLGPHLLNRRRQTWKEICDANDFERSQRREGQYERRRMRRTIRQIQAGYVERKGSGKPRRPRMFTLNGETLHMSAWAKRCGVSRERIRQRLLKYPPETAIGAYLTAEVPS